MCRSLNGVVRQQPRIRPLAFSYKALRLNTLLEASSHDATPAPLSGSWGRLDVAARIDDSNRGAQPFRPISYRAMKRIFCGPFLAQVEQAEARFNGVRSVPCTLPSRDSQEIFGCNDGRHVPSCLSDLSKLAVEYSGLPAACADRWQLAQRCARQGQFLQGSVVWAPET